MAISDIKGLSVSSQKDFSFVIHLGIDSSLPMKERGKGDLIFLSSSVIEISTKITMAYRKATNIPLPVTVSDSFNVVLDAKGPIELTFEAAPVPSHGKEAKVSVLIYSKIISIAF